MKTNSLKKAKRLIGKGCVAYKKARELTIEILRQILEPVGENGATITCLGDQEGSVCWATDLEEERQLPVTLVRVKDGELQLFLSEYDTYDDPEFGTSVRVFPDGHWYGSKEIDTDWWLLLGLLEANLESADGYDEQ